MNKRTMFMIGAVSAALITSAAAADAKPTPHSVYVDGTKVNCAAYEIAGNNYFKLRDIAAMVNGTEKQFEVTWNEAAKRIDLSSNKPYTTVGGEMGAVSAGTKNAKNSTATVYKDGSKATYTGYNINENNYYKLRDVAKAFDIGIEWDAANQRVNVLTTTGYKDEAQTDSGKKDDANVNNPGTTQTPSAPTYDDPSKLQHLTERPANPPTPDPTNPARDNRYWYMPADEDLPADGEYSQQYLDYLNKCGENIRDLEIRFHMYGYSQDGPHDIANTKLELWVTPKGQKGVDHFILIGYVTTDATGRGSFGLKIPESVYNMMLADQGYTPYFLAHKGEVYATNGAAFEASADIDNYMIRGYNGDLQIRKY